MTAARELGAAGVVAGCCERESPVCARDKEDGEGGVDDEGAGEVGGDVAIGEEGGPRLASLNRACTWRVARMLAVSSEVHKLLSRHYKAIGVHTYLDQRGFVVGGCCLQSHLPRRIRDQVSACLRHPQTRQ